MVRAALLFRILVVATLVLAAVGVLVPSQAQPVQGRKHDLITRAPAPRSKVPAKVTNSIGMKLVRIPPGKFMMGSPADEKDRYMDEEQHEVEITKDFYLGMHEVTQKQFRTIMGFNPSHFSTDGKGKPGVEHAEGEPTGGKDKVSGMDTDDFPVENVSWHDAVEFCTRLSAQAAEKKRGWTYRLPTEAEWEYACRGGAPSYQVFHFGNSLGSPQANIIGNHPDSGPAKGPDLERTCKVGSYRPNAFGLHDMHGNVWEWCSDSFDEAYYSKSPRRDPQGPSGTSWRVIRGGTWDCTSKYCRSAIRGADWPDYQTCFLGFRVAMVPGSR
jgi:formylglycine-generating enzyme required for sulfatase activity